MSGIARLTPGMQAVMARLAEQAAGGPSRYAMPFPQARQVLEAQREWWQEGAPTMALERKESQQVGQRSIPVRFYRPAHLRSDVRFVYLHGGGFCVGSWKTHGAIMRWLAHETGLEVVGVDYALAPEHPFPAGLEDCNAIIDILLAKGHRLVVGGDSAGANLALVNAMVRRDAGKPLPEALVLYYGTFGPVRPGGSFAQWGGGDFGLSVAALERYAAAYTPEFDSRADPRVAPLAGELSGLPPALLVAAGCDPLLDDSIELHERLIAKGSQARLIRYDGIIHGYLAYWRMLDEARQTFTETKKFLDGVFDLDAR
jgi:acetyl esterase